MNIQKEWVALVNQTMTSRRIQHAHAWTATAQAHPEMAILMRAAGVPRQALQFANARNLSRRTPQQRLEFANAVEDEMRQTHCPYGVAFNRVAAARREFTSGQFVQVQLPGGKSRPPGQSATASFVNDNDVASLPKNANGVPVGAPWLKEMFRLPMDTTDSEWAAAWEGNGSAGSPLNFGKIFDALTQQAQKEKSLDYEGALQATKARFPQLWSAVEQMAKMI